MKKTPLLAFRLYAAVAATSALLGACGGGDGDSVTGAPTAPPPTPTVPAPAPAPVNVPAPAPIAGQDPATAPASPSAPVPVPAPVPTPVPTPAPGGATPPLPSDPVAGANQPGQISISGEAKVGRTLTAHVTDGDGVPSTGIVYQWLANGQAIAGADDAAYQVASGDAGKRLSVFALYTDNRGHAESPGSEPTAAVVAQNLPASVSIAGSAKVGQTLTARITDADGLPDAAAIAYQWLADARAIVNATAATYQVQYGDVGKVLAVRASFTDRMGHAEAPLSATTALVVRDGQPSAGGYHVYQHAVYGKYLDARDFGADPSGRVDSIGAIRQALAAAHDEGAALYLNGQLKVSEQIRIDADTAKVTALFGDGMGKTVITFDRKQVGVYNPNSNEDDVRADAGILIDGQSGKTVADLSLKYAGEFYRVGESYFGKVNGILVSDASRTTISRVEVSGANRAGVMFDSRAALTPDPSDPRGRTFKARLIRGEITESGVPVGTGNRIIDSHLHHNRVAGALLAYQKDFLATGNTLSRNGHAADGGTGYGIATMAGSYNFGVTFRGNTTDHNYRKGLDVHDGNHIVIENNTAVGDRLYGISVYNRQFSMTRVRIVNNTVKLDPAFRLDVDDDPGSPVKYHGVAGIHLSTNTQRKNLHSVSPGQFEILGNTITGLGIYKNAQHTYGIEFRNHEQQIDYTLDITNNQISGTGSAYQIAVINDTEDLTVTPNAQGPGSGTIRVVGNTAKVEHIASVGMPLYVAEKNTNGGLRGSITVTGNTFAVSKTTDGWTEGLAFETNARTMQVGNNTFELRGAITRPVVRITGQGTSSNGSFTLTGNRFTTDATPSFTNGDWLAVDKVSIKASGNHPNGNAIADVTSN